MQNKIIILGLKKWKKKKNIIPQEKETGQEKFKAEIRLEKRDVRDRIRENFINSNLLLVNLKYFCYYSNGYANWRGSKNNFD